MNIIIFNWNPFKGDNVINCESVVIGIEKYIDARFVSVKGFSLDIINELKENKYHDLSCHKDNLVSEVKSITKDEAREKLISEIDKIINFLFDEKTS